MKQVSEVYVELVGLMKSIDYYNKYPSRRYLRDLIDREDSLEGKARAILRDSLIQREIFPNWLSTSHNIVDSLEYYLKLNAKK